MTMTHELQPHPATSLSRTAANDSPPSARPNRQHNAGTDGPVINLVVAALLALAIIGALVGFGGDAAANGPVEPVSDQSQLVDDTIEVYIVQPGDTLWAIATEVARPGEDIRPIVDELKALTGGAQLDIGQRIIIDHATIRG